MLDDAILICVGIWGNSEQECHEVRIGNADIEMHCTVLRTEKGN